MWTVTTGSEMIDEREQREHRTSVLAWRDYQGRILEFEIGGYVRESEETAKYGREWVCELRRGDELVSVTIGRTG